MSKDAPRVERHWIQVTPSEFEWEREALAYLKERLPDHEPYRAWANFEFLLNGTIGEVDTLVVVPKGIFLVEIKSWPGRLEGDAGTWRLTRGDRTKSFDNPLIVTNRKAKRLKSLLMRQRPMRGVRDPFVQPVVFLSHPELDCRLGAFARDHVYGLDGDSPQRGGLTGIVAALSAMTAEEHQRLGSRRVDKPASRRIAEALEAAGVRPSQSRRKVGELELAEQLDDGPGWQDFDAAHPQFPGVHRRVRIYGSSDLAGRDAREAAVRAARREFELLAPVSHPGVLRAIDFREHELGPAIVFEREESEQRLDHFLSELGGALNFADRVALVRDVAEAIAYAHSRRLYHRALSPRCVMVVDPGGQRQRLVISNWQAGARAHEGTAAATVEGTHHVEAHVEEAASAYLAPEALVASQADAELLDVFSLGAIAYHVFTGRPPASSLAGLVSILDRDGALEVAAVLDGASGYLSEMVRDATAADTSQRTASTRELLDALALVEEDATSADDADTGDVAPGDATKGTVLAGELTVQRRLGRGSTAIAFLVADATGRPRVLKVAADPDRNERVRSEAEVLARLDHSAIVAIHGTPVDVAGHTGIVLAHAALGTLKDWLRDEGRASLEYLERWGADLLSAVAYLEREGIAHRDIKPDNLGITERGQNKRRHLLLLDFSLARAPAEQLDAGTPPYLDPFLGTGDRRRFDLAAERFSAAVVLHEMASGRLPVWGDGTGNPRYSGGEARLARDRFPRQLAGALEQFLARGLCRAAGERFGTAEEMLQAWQRMFAGLQAEGEENVADEAAIQRARDTATFDTPLAALGLSSAALEAAEREGALAAGALLDVAPIRFNQLTGVGLRTRAELRGVAAELRERLGSPARPAGASPDTVHADEHAPDVQELDDLAEQLVPRRTARNEREAEAIGLLLGLSGELGAWASQTDIAARLDVTRARVGQVVAAARERWRRLPSLTRLRTEIRERHLPALGGVAEVGELARLVAADRGARDTARAALLAAAAVRAAIEAEAALGDPRLAQRRTGERVLVAGAGSDPGEAQRILAWAARLGARADELAGSEPLPAAAQVATDLRRLAPPPDVPALGQERLVRLAAAASQRAAVSAQLELHPRDLAPQRLLELGGGALLGARELSPDQVRERVAARFPQAPPLPGRPALDALLGGAGLDLDFDSARGVYVARERIALTGLTSMPGGFTRMATASPTRLPPRSDPGVLAAQAFEERLQTALQTGGVLTLLVSGERAPQAGRELRRLPVTVLDLDQLMLDAFRTVAHEAGADWEIVLRADAAPDGSPDRINLQRLVQRAMPRVDAAVTAVEGVALLEHPGLLARYDQLGLVARLGEVVRDGRAALRGAWLLVPADAQATLPLVDGRPVPVISTNEWARIPEPWLGNLHRGAPPPAPLSSAA